MPLMALYWSGGAAPGHAERKLCCCKQAADCNPRFEPVPPLVSPGNMVGRLCPSLPPRYMYAGGTPRAKRLQPNLLRPAHAWAHGDSVSLTEPSSGTEGGVHMGQPALCHSSTPLPLGSSVAAAQALPE
jgi:hypothetical protein